MTDTTSSFASAVTELKHPQYLSSLTQRTAFVGALRQLLRSVAKESWLPPHCTRSLCMENLHSVCSRELHKFSHT